MSRRPVDQRSSRSSSSERDSDDNSGKGGRTNRAAAAIREETSEKPQSSLADRLRDRKKQRAANAPEKDGRGIRRNQTEPESSDRGRRRSAALDIYEQAVLDVPEDYKKRDFNSAVQCVHVLSTRNPESTRDHLVELLKTVDGALKQAVNEHYGAVNLAFRSFAQTVKLFTNTRTDVQSLRDLLLQSKELLAHRNPTLEPLVEKTAQLKHIVRLLDKIDELSKAPDTYQALFGGRKYLRACKLMADSLQDLTSYELSGIGALRDIRAFLVAQRAKVHEILIDELQNTIYSYPNQQASLTTSTTSSQPATTPVARSHGSLMQGGKLQIQSFTAAIAGLAAAQGSPPEAKETKLEPASDDGLSEGYSHLRGSEREMQVLIEALQVVNHLATAQGVLSTKLRSRLSDIIRERASSFYKQKGVASSALPGSNLGITAFPQGSDFAALLQQIFAIFISVLRNSAFVCQQFSKKGLSSLPVRGHSSYTIEDVWSAMQMELQSFILEHLQPPTALGIQVVLPFKRKKRKKEKKHKAALSTASPEPNMDPNTPGGQAALDGSVPALTFRFADSALAAELQALLAKDGVAGKIPYIPPGVAIHPSPFFALHAARPILQFVNAVEQLFGLSTISDMMEGGLRLFLDDCIHEKLLPRLKADAKKSLNEAMESPDGFRTRGRQQLQYDSNEQTRPLLQSVFIVGTIIDDLTKAISVLQSYVPEVMALLRSLLSTFADRCVAAYKQASGDSFSATCMSDDIVFNLYTQDPDYKAIRCMPSGGTGNYEPPSADAINSFREEERIMEVRLGFHTALAPPLSKDDLILYQQMPRLVLLMNLSDSLDWLYEKLLLKCDDPSKGPASIGMSKSLSKTQVVQSPMSCYISPYRPYPQFVPPKPTPRPVLQSSSQNFGSGPSDPAWKEWFPVDELKDIANQYRTIAQRSLFTLRLELRCHCFYFVDQFSTASYVAEDDVGEADRFVGSMSKDLTRIDEALHAYLPQHKIHYLYAGLGMLLESIFISALRKIGSVNSNGVLKILRNIFALQQNLPATIPLIENHLDKVHQYYELLNLPQQGLLLFRQEHPTFFADEQFRALAEADVINRPAVDKTSSL